jgi:transcriptional regulator with XRE-family HTH domain
MKPRKQIAPFSHAGKEKGSTPFGDRLKKERMRRGFTIQAFADRVGCHHCQITGAENRGVVPHFFTIVAMAQVLECSLDFLAGLED